MGLTYNDTNLQKLFEKLEPKQRRTAFRKAFRRCANKVRAVAVRNLKSSGLNHTDELSASIRPLVYKRYAGYWVTVVPRKANRRGKGEAGMHKNRRGLKKPVLFWASTGTKKRRVKKLSPLKVKAGGRYITLGRNRGSMKQYGFMWATMRQVRAGATEDLRNELTESIRKIAKKYGCT